MVSRILSRSRVDLASLSMATVLASSSKNTFALPAAWRCAS
jgi:hypothetical protein